MVVRQDNCTQSCTDMAKYIQEYAEGITKDTLFDKKYLDFEKLYYEHGWKVTYESPSRDESFKEYFIFEPKDK